MTKTGRALTRAITIMAIGSWLAGCGGNGSDDPTTGTEAQTSACLNCVAANTGTGIGTATIPPTTVPPPAVATGVSTDTDTTGVPSWCNQYAYNAPNIGSPSGSEGAWLWTCGEEVWNIYITFAWQSTSQVRGYGFKATDLNAAPAYLPVPSEVNYIGVMATNCLYLAPSLPNTTAPTISASGVTMDSIVSSGNCTFKLTPPDYTFPHKQ